MKLLIIAAVMGVCLGGRLDNSYLPPTSGGTNFGGSQPARYQQQPNFGAKQTAFAGQQSSFAAQSAGFGGQPAGFGGQQAGFGGQQAGFGGQQAGFGAQQGSYGGQQSFGGFSGQYQQQQQQSTRQQASFEQNAQILKYNNQDNGDGTFSYDFETSNGIRADASGIATNGVQEQGSFSYKGDDGQDYSISYTADENGYRPQGAHLPTPPPIPEAILKSLEQNARDEAAGISDDGQYRGEGTGAGGHSGQAYTAPTSQYGSPSGQAQQYNSPSAQYQTPFAGNQGPKFGGQQQQQQQRQYIPPQQQQKSGSGNFNPQSGYHY